MTVVKTNGHLEAYAQAIEDRTIPAGQELRAVLRQLMEDMDGDEWVYDTTEADRRMAFMEGAIRMVKAPFYGKPMRLLAWQRAFLSAVYGFRTPEGLPRFQRVLLLVSRKNGKALALDTPVLTPEGWRTIGDIEPGDRVFGEDGEPADVIATSEVFTDHRCYEVEFEDGERIVADAGHKWLVKVRDKREPHVRVLTTEDMKGDFMRIRKDGKGCEFKYRVPIGGPIQRPRRDLPLDPYVLGQWLGNGNRTDCRISCGAHDAEEVVRQFERVGMPVKSVKDYGGKIEVNFGRRIPKPHGGFTTDAREVIRDLGIWGHKRIPEMYLDASVEQRMELLCGLMDTDGTVSKAGQCSWTQSKKDLMDDFSRLLASLGIKHTIREYDVPLNGKTFHAWEAGFFVDKSRPCFHYPRKIARLKDALAPRMMWKSIVGVREVPTVPTKCLCVNTGSGLFRAGARHTVTHNSSLCSALLLTDMILGGHGRDIVCSSNDDLQADILFQACDTMREMLDPKSKDTWRNQKGIKCLINDNRMFKLSDKTRNKEGRAVDVAVVDEVHEMRDNVIVKSIEQSQSTKDDPLLIMITTEGVVNEGFLDAELRRAREIIAGEATDLAARRYLPWLYTQDSEREVWEGNRENRLWMKSNPTLGEVKRWDYLEQQVDLARQSRADRAYVLCKDFNIKQNSSEAWLMPEDYGYDLPVNMEALRGGVLIGGVDLAETTDLSCAKALVMVPGSPIKHFVTQYFAPEGKLERSDDRSAGARYDQWAREGLLKVCPGNYMDVSAVADWFYGLYQDYGIRPYFVGYDARFATDFVNRMEQYGFDTEIVYQSPEVLNTPIKMVEADLKSHHIAGLSDMDRWCLSNACLKLDSRGNGLLVKADGLHSRRIDGAVATAIAYEVYRRHRSEYELIVSKL